jgi:hypothetical protein
VKNRFQSLPFKRNLQRYTAVLRDAHGVEVFQTLQEPGDFVVTWWGSAR